MTTIDYNYTIIDYDTENRNFTVRLSSSSFTGSPESFPVVSIGYSQILTVTDVVNELTNEIIQERIQSRVFPVVANLIQQEQASNTTVAQNIESYLDSNLLTPVSGFIITSL
jgi:hypothetical protein